MHRKHLDSIQIGAIIHHHKREILKHSLAAHPSKHSCFGAIWLLQNALDRSKRRALRCQRDIPNERRLDDYEHLPTLTIRFLARTQKRENLSIRKTRDNGKHLNMEFHFHESVIRFQCSHCQRAENVHI